MSPERVSIAVASVHSILLFIRCQRSAASCFLSLSASATDGLRRASYPAASAADSKQKVVTRDRPLPACLAGAQDWSASTAHNDRCSVELDGLQRTGGIRDRNTPRHASCIVWWLRCSAGKFGESCTRAEHRTPNSPRSQRQVFSSPHAFGTEWTPHFFAAGSVGPCRSRQPPVLWMPPSSTEDVRVVAV